MNVCGYERGYVNVNMTVFVSVNGDVVDCVDAHKKFLRLLTKLNDCAIMASQNKNVRPLGNLIFVFELMRMIPIFEFDF